MKDLIVVMLKLYMCDVLDDHYEFVAFVVFGADLNTMKTSPVGVKNLLKFSKKKARNGDNFKSEP